MSMCLCDFALEVSKGVPDSLRELGRDLESLRRA